MSLENKSAPTMPTAPLIFVGHSGSGKSTLMRHVEAINNEFKHSMCRYSTRLPRNKTEMREGHFVNEEIFDEKLSEKAFAFWYQRYDNRYGFHTRTIEKEMDYANPMIVGGKEDTAKQLKDSLQLRKNLSGALNEDTLVFQPVLLFVSREIEKVIEGIKMRDGSDEEKAKRIQAVEAGYTPEPIMLDHQEVFIIDNNEDDPMVGAKQVIDVTNLHRKRILQDLLGTQATTEDWFAYLEGKLAC